MSNTPRTDAVVANFVTYPTPKTIIDLAGELERENTALWEDKLRLRWLCTQTGSSFCYGYLRENFKLTRAAIDAAREAKP